MRSNKIGIGAVRLFVTAMALLMMATTTHSSPIAAHFTNQRPPYKAETTSSTTTDWLAVCEDLCKTGDGGVLCNCDLIPVLVVVKAEKEAAVVDNTTTTTTTTTVSRTTAIDWVSVCTDLCSRGDGGVLCNCDLIPVKAIMKNVNIRNNIARPNNVAAAAAAAAAAAGPITTTLPPSTTAAVDWVAVCTDLCKTGDGGVLCNCDLIPVLLVAADNNS